ncbi:MAG TPA: DNA gyrase subunit A, partial [Mycobacteriales bacterium]|nr:DNA gyrase subunit A [Mycobacteriales bacterium]
MFARQREHIVSALVSAQENWREVATLVSEAPSLEVAISSLMQTLGYDEQQADAICAMQLLRLVGSERDFRRKELEDLREQISQSPEAPR